MIWNIPSIEHILSACLNYSLNSSLKKCAHTHAHTHKHTGICEYTDYSLCIYSQKRMGGWTDKYMCSNVKWVTVCNVWQQHQLKLYTQALPSSSISTKQNLLCVCVCICAYVQVCLGLARQQSSLRLHTHRKAQSNNKGLSKEPSAG